MDSASQNLSNGHATAPATPNELKARVLACKPMREGWQDAAVGLDPEYFEVNDRVAYRKNLIKLRNVFNLSSTDEGMTQLIEAVYPDYRV